MSRESNARSSCVLFVLSLVACTGLVGTGTAVGQEATTPTDTDDWFSDVVNGDSSLDSTADDGAAAAGEGADPLQSDAEAQRQQALEVYREAKALADQGKYAEAIEKYYLLFRAAPEFSVPAAVEHGRCFVELDEPGQAVESFMTAQRNLQPYMGMNNEELGFAIESYEIILEMSKAMIDEGRMADAMGNL